MGLYGLLSLLVYVLIACVFMYAVYWALGKLALPEPWGTIITFVFVIVLLLLLIGFLRQSGLV